MTIDDELATLLDIDPVTRSEITPLLTGMTAADRQQAAIVRELLIDELGGFAAEGPEPPVDLSPAAWVAGVLAAAPAVAGWMTDHGVASPVIGATLGDVGRHLRLQRRNAASVGLDAPGWMFAVLSGGLYQLGRLQFDLRPRRPSDADMPSELGDWLLDVHIPEAGPLTPEAVTASFEDAVGFFGAHFPDRPVRGAVCASWLLDPYLGEHLASTSNVVAFQRLFTPYGEPRDDQLDAMYFTFGQRHLEHLDLLPRQSSLQRLVLDRLAAGGHWSVVNGYRELMS